MSEYFLRTLFVHTPGTRLILEGGAVKALRDDKAPRRLPLTQIDSIVVGGGVDVSTPLLLKCAEDGRLVAFISRYGKPRAVLEGPTSGRGRLRGLQYERRRDAELRTAMAADLVGGKLGNLRWGLNQWSRDADAERREVLKCAAAQVEDLVSALGSCSSRDQVLGVEGAATRAYFDGLRAALREFAWSGRTRRPTRDPVNAGISFAYGLTRIAVHGALHVVGLDPYFGYLHGDTDGQPSLVLDLMEEFRPTADRVVVSMLNKRKLSVKHFEYDVVGNCTLTSEGREVLMAGWFDHRTAKVRVVGARAPVANAALPIIQANALANALRTGKAYRPHRLIVR